MLSDRRIGWAAEAALGDHAATFQKGNLPAGIRLVSRCSEDFRSLELVFPKTVSF